MIGDRVGGAPLASPGGPPTGIGPFHTQSLGVLSHVFFHEGEIGPMPVECLDRDGRGTSPWSHSEARLAPCGSRLGVALEVSRKPRDALQSVVDLWVTRASESIEGEPLDIARVPGSRLTRPCAVPHLHAAHAATIDPPHRNDPRPSWSGVACCAGVGERVPRAPRGMSGQVDPGGGTPATPHPCT